MIEGSVDLTSSGAVVGTPVYMSPEQGSGQKIDSRTDIYSLGVILYQMATGHVPYQAETPMAVILKHINDPLPPPRTVNPHLPEAVELVILKALSKRVQDRYPTAHDLTKAVRHAIPETISTPLRPKVPGRTWVPATSPRRDFGPGAQDEASAPARKKVRPALLLGCMGILGVTLIGLVLALNGRVSGGGLDASLLAVITVQVTATPRILVATPRLTATRVLQALPTATHDPLDLELDRDALIGSGGSDPGRFSLPRGIAVAQDGSLYVADAGNHRIQRLAEDGTVLSIWGSFASIDEARLLGTFNEPWGVGVAPDSSV
jgi:hypothetical protein